MAWYDDPLTVIAVAVVIIIAVGVVVYAMRRFSGTPRKPKAVDAKKSPVALESSFSSVPNVPYRLSKSVQAPMAANAKDELRMLDLEREILGDALRRLYEAQAEGKITEAEREKLAASYKKRMNDIKESISKDESIIALHELEGMQEDLMKLFSERFGELTGKVEELRTRIDVKPIREVAVKVPAQVPVQMDDEEEEEDEEEPSESRKGEEKPKKKRKPPEQKPTQKSESEKRIESIRSEVEKVLDKLGQMEVEV